MKIKETADVFLDLFNFVKNTFLTLAPPSSYALNRSKKHWSRCQKSAENLSFPMKYLEIFIWKKNW